MTDEYPPEEAAEEQRWKETGGVDPDTGEMWLTPRMERNAAALVATWKKWEEDKKS